MRKSRSRSPFRPARTLLAVLALSAVTARAAEIYVLDAVLERDGSSSVSPTFIVTPGERALLSFEGERELDVAMTLTPREGTDTTVTASQDGAFELRVELVDGVDAFVETVPVALAETEELEIGGRTIKVLVRVQEPLGSGSEPAAAPADGD